MKILSNSIKRSGIEIELTSKTEIYEEEAEEEKSGGRHC